MLLGIFPMYFIAVAYAELNSEELDCGTTFTWAVAHFGPWWGWLGGWGIIAADVIVMSNLSQIAGRYGFLLFGRRVGRRHLLDDRSPAAVDRRDDLHLLPGIEVSRGCSTGAGLRSLCWSPSPSSLGRCTPVARRRVPSRPASAGLAVRAVVERDHSRRSCSRCSSTGLGHGGRDERGVRRPRQDTGARGDLSTVLLWPSTPWCPSRRSPSPDGQPGIGLATRTTPTTCSSIGPAVFGESTAKVFEVLLLDQRADLGSSGSPRPRSCLRLPRCRWACSTRCPGGCQDPPRYLICYDRVDGRMGIVSIVFSWRLTLYQQRAQPITNTPPMTDTVVLPKSARRYTGIARRR